jgi:hypothetical protein
MNSTTCRQPATLPTGRPLFWREHLVRHASTVPKEDPVIATGVTNQTPETAEVGYTGACMADSRHLHSVAWTAASNRTAEITPELSTAALKLKTEYRSRETRSRRHIDDIGNRWGVKPKSSRTVGPDARTEPMQLAPSPSSGRNQPKRKRVSNGRRSFSYAVQSNFRMCTGNAVWITDCARRHPTLMRLASNVSGFLSQLPARVDFCKAPRHSRTQRRSLRMCRTEYSDRWFPHPRFTVEFWRKS